MVEDLEGISPCFSASTALAGVVHLLRRGEFPRNDTVLINLTGSDRQPSAAPSHVHWLKQSEAGWEPEDPADSSTQALWFGPEGTVRS